MAVDRYSLNQWLQIHREHFITFTVEEIAEQAVVYGFTKEEVDNSILKRDRRFL